jgi:hypothetical protein
MSDNYQQQPGYAHWRSAKFMLELEYSVRIFDKVVYGNCFRYPRPIGPPNTPAELGDDDSEYDSDDGFEGICGPDEDYYISMAEGISIGFWPYSWYGYWPEGHDGVYIDGIKFQGLAIGFSKPREYD